MAEDNRETVLETVRQLTGHAAEMGRRGDLGGARRRFEEARMALGRLADDEDPARLAASASVHEGKGQLALGVGKLDEALLQLSEAVRCREREEAATGSTRHLEVAVSHMNLSSVFSQQQRSDAAMLHASTALSRLEQIQDDPTGRFFLVAALQTMGMLQAAADDDEAALATYGRAIERATMLYDEGLVEIAELLTQIRINAAIASFSAERFEAALSLGRQAVDEAWARVEADGGEESLSQYCTGQMNMVAYCEAVGDFAGAEDALFKVIKLVGPQREIVERGRQLYRDLLRLDDARLEAGNLPRDEVEESLAELEQLVVASDGERD